MNAFPGISEIVSLISSAIRTDDRPVSLHQPYFGGKEWEYVRSCLDTGWVSSSGKYVEAFEDRLACYTGVKHAVAVVNGTAALHMCLLLAGVKPGDEVLVPALTFIATANAVKYCGAVPHFADSEYKSLGVNPDKLGDYLGEIASVKNGKCWNKYTERPLRALIVMHTYGHPVDLDPVLEICKKYRLELIEDAAEALGSFYKGRHVGSHGKLSALSFNGNKIVTSGGGGAILTNDSNLAKAARHLTTTARLPHKWAFVHDRIGYNYRLPNLNAALGCAQMEQIEGFVRKKRALAKKYRLAFANVQGIRFFEEPPYAESNYWLNALILDEEYSKMRDSILAATHEQGILTRPPWVLMNKLKMYEDCPHMDLSTAESLEQRIINVPSSACLGADQGEA